MCRLQIKTKRQLENGIYSSATRFSLVIYQLYEAYQEKLTGIAMVYWNQKTQTMIITIM